MRDSQRQAVYHWERKVGRVYNLDRQKLTLDESKLYAGYIWNKYVSPHRGPITVKDGRGRKAACYELFNTIKLPRWSRYPQVIIHEIGHGIIPNNFAAHGREFSKWVYEVWCRELKLPRNTVRMFAVHQKPRRVRFVTLAKLNEILQDKNHRQL